MKLKFLRLRLTVLSVSSTLSLGLFAQTDSLKDVVVSASRFEEPRLNAPTAVQVITQEDIKNSGSTSLPDVLQMLGGINVRSISAGQLGLNSAVDLGGFGPTAAQNTLILLDGRRLNPIDSSEVVWSGIPLSSIQRIEIAPGAAGVQYGAGATGGVIHIITNEKIPERTQVGVRFGSFGTSSLNFNLDRQINDLTVSLNAGASRSAGWRENSQAKSQNLAFKVKQSFGSRGYVFGEVLLGQQINGFPGGVLGKVGEGHQQAAKFNNVGSENTLNQSGLRLGGFTTLSDQTSLDADLVLGKRSSNFKQPYYDTADSLDSAFGYVTGAGHSRANGTDLSFSPKFRTEFANGTSLVYGYDFSKSNQDGSNSFGPLAQQLILTNQGPFKYQGNIISDLQSVQLRNQSIYAISRIPLGQAWELSLGARRQTQSYNNFDSNKSSGTQAAAGAFGATAHEAALNYKLSNTSRTYLRVSQSYRFASTDEYWGFDANGNRIFSGELRPQITKAYEVGYDLKADRQQFSVIVGKSVTQDEIRYNPASFSNSNLADQVLRTSLAANWAVQVMAKSRLSLGARFQRAEYRTGAYAGQALGLVPNAIYNVGWLQAIDARTRAGVQVLHVSKQNYDASPDSVATLDKMPAYTTADVFFARSYGKLETRLTIKNLTGSTYAAYGGYGFVSTPGAGGKNSYYHYPSDPRALLLSLTYSF